MSVETVEVEISSFTHDFNLAMDQRGECAVQVQVSHLALPQSWPGRWAQLCLCEGAMEGEQL